jgi:hypothetical protein
VGIGIYVIKQTAVFRAGDLDLWEDQTKHNGEEKNDAALISFCTNDMRTIRKCVKKIIFQHNHHHHHCSHLSHHPSPIYKS